MTNVQPCQGENIYACGVKDIYNNILKAIKQMKVDNQSLTFYIGIDGTKIPPSLNLSNAHKSMMGDTYPNHMINIIKLDKECINKMLKNEEKPIDIYQELKVTIMCTQNQRKGASTMTVIASRPQGVNVVSTFAEDVALLVVKELSSC